MIDSAGRNHRAVAGQGAHGRARPRGNVCRIGLIRIVKRFQLDAPNFADRSMGASTTAKFGDLALPPGGPQVACRPCHALMGEDDRRRPLVAASPNNRDDLRPFALAAAQSRPTRFRPYPSDTNTTSPDVIESK